MTDTSTNKSSATVAAENWARYEYGRQRGHIEYCEQARRCENFYLGGGRQWSKEDIDALDGRPAIELNHILPSVNTALGHQIQNRMDISFLPRGAGADQNGADLLSKVIMSIADSNRLHWSESAVYADGMIQQRGYFDVRMAFDRNVFGDARVAVPDPMDVIPDPDAKSYHPNDWSDVIRLRWMTLDEIEDEYGKEARRIAELSNDEDNDFGAETSEEDRSKFGSIRQGLWSTSFGEQTIKRLRVIDRQVWRYDTCEVAIFPTGEIRLAEGMSIDRRNALKQLGCYFIKRRTRRVRWIVTTRSQTLFDKWSPYDRFTIIPFFPYFRRGQTVGMVDNAISPQEMLNKEASQYLHTINGTANSGYFVEENSLTNMDTDDLEERGAQNGIVIEYRQGTQKPEKITANPVPTGMDRAIERSVLSLKEITGISDAMQGLNGPEVSGVAIQSKQFMGQQQLAVPLENLNHTRNMLAEHLLYLVQNFYDSFRVFKITEQDPVTGKQMVTDISVNVYQPGPDGSANWLNDLTVGDYDVVIDERPAQATFENTQFQQALELRKAEVPIPDYVVIRHSSLSEKADIIKAMRENEGKADPEKEAKVQLITAQTKKTMSEAVNKAIEGMFSATQAANQIAMNPAIAPMADQMLKSGGFEDADAAPIIPEAAAGVAALDLPQNTNPITPTNPAVGMNAGIEGGAVQ